jgi:phosphopantothenoylcysteine synthetase/decarboxylase
MYTHPFTAEHLLLLEQKLGYLISGPQGAGMLACGDAGESRGEEWLMSRSRQDDGLARYCQDGRSVL